MQRCRMNGKVNKATCERGGSAVSHLQPALDPLLLARREGRVDPGGGVKAGERAERRRVTHRRTGTRRRGGLRPGLDASEGVVEAVDVGRVDPASRPVNEGNERQSNGKEAYLRKEACCMNTSPTLPATSIDSPPPRTAARRSGRRILRWKSRMASCSRGEQLVRRGREKSRKTAGTHDIAEDRPSLGSRQDRILLTRSRRTQRNTRTRNVDPADLFQAPQVRLLRLDNLLENRFSLARLVRQLRRGRVRRERGRRPSVGSGFVVVVSGEAARVGARG